ncbi:hypothetical protein BD324DRAFT_333136 [Kockovaella imperatae]|uniref:Transcription initiation factor TFIID subunit 12 domain-containing protein n=1 Tax=Kockovaella imperatae TaxID=4999 RepID=A0A1Y1UN15_9TREE|nr:hypothetical protein BD324DRAFT_333136 [Kockovaella imperatae]ORX39451.1 hypothetical protein BD324DRAFT_333136 [Kockovaella imperatae]
MARPPPASGSGTSTPAGTVSSGPSPAQTPSAASGSAARPPASNQSRGDGLMNIPAMLNLDKAGKLDKDQISKVRTMILQQARPIVAMALHRNQPNPLLALPPHLNPSMSAEGQSALINKADFEILMAKGVEDSKKIGEIMPMSEIKKLLVFTQEQRHKMLLQDPVLKLRFTRSLTHYAQFNKANASNASSNPGNTPSNTNTAPSSTATPGSIPSVNASTSANSVPTPVAPVVPMVSGPPPLPPAPPIKMETEDERRKRKFTEMLQDEGGGIHAEMGIFDVLGDVLDSFIDSEARRAIRLAKHRKSPRVELKDVAFAIDDSYGISVPGFNAQVRDRIHTAPEADKKRRTVVPLKSRASKKDES